MPSNDFARALAGTPSFSTDADILAEQETARKKRKERGRSILPAADFSPALRDRVQAALLGVGRGIGAAQGAGDPFAAAVAGITGAAGAPSAEQIAQARMMEEQKAQLAAIDSMPFEEVSPELAEAMPFLKGIPLVHAAKMLPFLESITKQSAVSASAGQDTRKLANDLRKEFINRPEVKEFVTVSTNVRSMDSLLKSALTGDEKNKVALDQALITLYNKLTDPTSVVRESEYARTPENLPLVNRIIGGIKKIGEGGAGLDNADREALVLGAKVIANERGKTFTSARTAYESLADQFGTDKSLVTGTVPEFSPYDTSRRGKKAASKNGDPLNLKPAGLKKDPLNLFGGGK